MRSPIPTRPRRPVAERRAERELFFWTASMSLKLVVAAAAAVYLIISLIDGGGLVRDLSVCLLVG
jgi:hypothetical protein